jgi:hypothetical protein
MQRVFASDTWRVSSGYHGRKEKERKEAAVAALPAQRGKLTSKICTSRGTVVRCSLLKGFFPRIGNMDCTLFLL